MGTRKGRRMRPGAVVIEVIVGQTGRSRQDARRGERAHARAGERRWWPVKLVSSKPLLSLS